MRLFTGTFVDQSIFELIYSEIQKEFQSTVKGKWVEPENLHFTYNFIGDTDPGTAGEIRYSLKDYLRVHNSRLLIEGLGVLPNYRQPRILYARVVNPDGLVPRIQKEMEDILTDFFIEPENRPYKSHITFLRIKEADVVNFRQLVEKYSSLEFGTMTSFRVNLVNSDLTSSGPVYKPIG